MTLIEMEDVHDPSMGGWHSRLGDPDTSRDAVPKNLTKQALKVLRAYASGRRLLDYEAYEMVGMVGHQRCSDLRHLGYIERVGKKLMPSKKTGYTCKITARGLAFLTTCSDDET